MNEVKSLTIPVLEAAFEATLGGYPRSRLSHDLYADADFHKIASMFCQSDRLLAVTCELADEFKEHPGTQLTAWGKISEGIVLGVLAGLRVSGAFDEAKSGRTGGDASKTG